MFNLFINNYNIAFNEIFEIREIKTGRKIGKYYFIQDNEDVFNLCKCREYSKKDRHLLVSSSMTGDILTGLMKNKITIIKINEFIK